MGWKYLSVPKRLRDWSLEMDKWFHPTLNGAGDYLFMLVFKSIHVSKKGRWLPSSWWRHQMETFSAVLALCVGSSPITGEFPSQRPLTRTFDVFFDLPLNKRFGDLRRHLAHYDVGVMLQRRKGLRWGLLGRQRNFRLTFVRAMACCRTAPSHYLDQWLYFRHIFYQAAKKSHHASRNGEDELASGRHSQGLLRGLSPIGRRHPRQTISGTVHNETRIQERPSVDI